MDEIRCKMQMHITPQETVLLCKLTYEVKVTSCFFTTLKTILSIRSYNTQLPHVNLIYLTYAGGTSSLNYDNSDIHACE